MIPQPLSRQFIADTEVLVWDLDLAEGITTVASNVLPPHEVQGALKARDPIIRRRRLAGRILVRCALSARMGREPEKLEFEKGSHGKPFLPSGPSFNVSHSANYLALAVRPSGRVGIDIEVVRDALDLSQLARLYFTESEQRGIATSRDGTAQGFFRVWVRKEALLKATGLGLALQLDSFSVSVDELPPATNALRWTSKHPDLSGEWLVTSLGAPPGTLLAVAVDRQG